MPTISQLPPAGSISAADEVPISQAGAARAVSVGALLASTQAVISIDSPSLLGRTSLGSGSPEQVDVGLGMILSGGTLVANGLDHSGFPLVPSLALESDLVISNQGRPMLMQASLLRGLFSAGQNVAIDANGVISVTDTITTVGTIETGSSIGALQVVTALASQDLVAVSQSGSDCAISYGNFLDGITINQAQPAGAAGDTDTTWVAQGSNVMASQTFSAIWVWIASKLPTYKGPVVEITTNTNLNTTVHNGRLLICSQPITLTPLISNMGSGFQCTVINASTGNLTLGSGFVSSSGSLVLTPWQSATLWCATYSAGTIAFAAMPTTAATTSISLPGQVVGLSASAPTSTTVTVSWQAPSNGGAVSSYLVQYRLTGATSWTSSASVAGATTYQLTALQAATSYDIVVQAQNATGAGTASAVLTVVTSTSTQTTTPPQVTGLTASPTSTSAIQLSWSAQTGSVAATSFTVQYRVTGSSGWTSSVTGISGTGTAITGLQAATSYDFEVIGVNTAGMGPASSTATAVTLTASQSVASITWLVGPSGTYTRGTGSIAVNAQVSPASAPIQFGFSQSTSTPPTSWTAAGYVNNNLWGAYLTPPATAGNWYVWAEGLDGSAQTVSPSPFTVQ
jgi:Fibronectin type III domain